MSENTVQDRQILELPLTEIKPYWRNPRDNREAVDKIAKSIKEYGYNQLIAVDTQNVIVAGHTRFLALKQLGWETAKVLIVDLPADKAKAYRIIDNKSAEIASWNHEDLALEMRELADLTMMTEFFTDSEIDKMMAAAAGQTYEPVTEEEVIAAEARLGSSKFGEQKMKDLVCPHCGKSFSVV